MQGSQTSCTSSVSRSFHEKNQKTYDISQGKFMSYNLLCILAILSIFLRVVKSWNRQYQSQTIHTTEKFNSMNLFKILCVVTWAQSFLTSMLMEAATGQKRYRECTLWPFNSTFGPFHSGSSGYQKRIKRHLNVHQEIRSVIAFSLHISNSRTKPGGLDF